MTAVRTTSAACAGRSGWLGAAMSYAKDLAVFKEATKNPRVALPPRQPDRTAEKEVQGDEQGGRRNRRRGKGPQSPKLACRKQDQ